MSGAFQGANAEEWVVWPPTPSTEAVASRATREGRRHIVTTLIYDAETFQTLLREAEASVSASVVQSYELIGGIAPEALRGARLARHVSPAMLWHVEGMYPAREEQFDMWLSETGPVATTARARGELVDYVKRHIPAKWKDAFYDDILCASADAIADGNLAPLARKWEDWEATAEIESAPEVKREILEAMSEDS